MRADNGFGDQMNAAVVIQKHWRGHRDSTKFVYHLINMIIAQVSITLTAFSIRLHEHLLAKTLIALLLKSTDILMSLHCSAGLPIQ